MSVARADTQQMVHRIEMLDLEELRGFWRRRYGVPPTLRSVPIMRMLLAWRVQVEEYGGIDADTRKALTRTGIAQPEGRQLGVGAILTRNWKGQKLR